MEQALWKNTIPEEYGAVIVIYHDVVYNTYATRVGNVQDSPVGKCIACASGMGEKLHLFFFEDQAYEREAIMEFCKQLRPAHDLPYGYVHVLFDQNDSVEVKYCYIKHILPEASFPLYLKEMTENE